MPPLSDRERFIQLRYEGISLGQRVYDKACFYARRNERRRLRRLMNKRAQLYSSDDSLLLFTAIWDNPDLVPWLLACGVSPDCRCGVGGNTPLMHAASNGNCDLIQLLLTFSADPMATNEDGERALGYACAWNQPDAAKLLIENGSDPNVPEDPDSTYLDWAKSGGHTDLFAVLTSRGAVPLSNLPENKG